MPTRRTLLTLGCAAIGSIAGCTSRIPGIDRSEANSDTVEIYQLAVQNGDDEHHEIGVVIEDGDGTEVFREELTLEPGTADGFEWPVDGAADYTLRAVVGSTTARERLAEYTEGDERCVAPVVRVRNADQLFIRTQTFNECTMD